jgi:ribonuclease BN (tRNA processing enzyme)
MGRLLSERGAEELIEALDEERLSDGSEHVVGDLAVTVHRVEHGEEAYAIAVVDPSGARLVYLGDGPATRGAVEVAWDCDVLLAEATLPSEYAGRAPHMTAAEAAALAKDANAASLVLTHVWPTTDRATILREAQEVFGGPVAVATEHVAFEVSPPERSR